MAHKKYHGHPKVSREEESKGGYPKMVKGEHPEYARRSKYMKDDALLKNDESKIANMPQDVKYHSYPYPSMLDEYYNDGLSGIDEQMEGDVGSLRKQYAPHKF